MGAQREKKRRNRVAVYLNHAPTLHGLRRRRRRRRRRPDSARVGPFAALALARGRGGQGQGGPEQVGADDVAGLGVFDGVVLAPTHLCQAKRHRKVLNEG